MEITENKILQRTAIAKMDSLGCKATAKVTINNETTIARLEVAVTMEEMGEGEPKTVEVGKYIQDGLNMYIEMSPTSPKTLAEMLTVATNVINTITTNIGEFTK